ncbi:hypothetical protein ACWDA9_39435, partial [Streptomyces sp. NPDC001193]
MSSNRFSPSPRRTAARRAPYAAALALGLSLTAAALTGCSTASKPPAAAGPAVSTSASAAPGVDSREWLTVGGGAARVRP